MGVAIKYSEPADYFPKNVLKYFDGADADKAGKVGEKGKPNKGPKRNVSKNAAEKSK